MTHTLIESPFQVRECVAVCRPQMWSSGPRIHMRNMPYSSAAAAAAESRRNQSHVSGSHCAQANMCDPGRHEAGSERQTKQQHGGHHNDGSSSMASSSHHHSHHGPASRPHGCAKRGGRPVTWIGGGGMDPKKLAGLGVPTLRALFSQVFGEATASNNAGWLRRKLAESPDNVHGQRRSPVVRARDMGAAIWNSSSPLVLLGGADTLSGGDGHGCGFGQQQLLEDDSTMEQQQLMLSSLEGTATTTGGLMEEGSSAHMMSRSSLPRRCLKRSAGSAESADTLGYKGNLPGGRGSPAPSGSDSASPTARGGSHSPRHKASSHNRHRNHLASHDQGSCEEMEQVYDGCAGLHGSAISPDCFSDNYLGLKVLVYWPADNKWWAATICKLNTAAQQMQLLYTDMTEESVSGDDYWELLRNGHLMLAAGQRPPSSTGMHTEHGQECTQPVPGVADAATAYQAGSTKPLTLVADAAGAIGMAPCRSQSCLLPLPVCATDPTKNLSRSASMGAGSAGQGAGGSVGGSRYSASGSGVDTDELAAKRRCYQVSAATCASTMANSDMFACTSMPEQQQGDAAKLGDWFASQQRQQLQLQQQVPQNLQYQQQVQMQMHQQMTAHMQMQQAAGKFMQLAVPALAAPCTDTYSAPESTAQGAGGGGHGTAGSPVPCAPAGANGSSCFVPHSNGGLAEEIRQLRELHLRLQHAVAQPDVAASCWASLQLGPAAGGCGNAAGVAADAVAVDAQGQQQQLQQLQQQQTQQCFSASMGLSIQVPAAGCSSLAGSAAGSPLPVQEPGDDAVVPAAAGSPVGAADVYAMCSPEGPSSSPVAKAATAAATNACIKVEPSVDGDLARAAGSSFEEVLQEGGPEDIDTLLAKPDDMFCLTGLECDMQAEDSFGGPSSSCGGSLCESVADELAVAGLGADDAPCYFSLFGGSGGCSAAAGSPLDESQEPDGKGADSMHGGNHHDAAAQAEREAFAHMFDFD